MGKRWTIEETDFLKDNWGNIPIKKIAKRLNRTEIAVTFRAINYEKLGPYIDNSKQVKLSEILKKLGYFGYANNLTCLTNIWDNLKTVKKIIRKRYIYMVNIKDFWKFAEKYQNKLNFVKFEKNSLGLEPKWVDKKRREDIKSSRQIYNKYKKWTKKDYSLIKSYLDLGYSHKDIAQKIGRTKTVVTDFISKNNLTTNCKWGKADIEKLFELRNKGFTYKEIAIELNRDYKSVKNKYYRSIDNENKFSV